MPYFVDWYLKIFSVIFIVPKSLQLKSKYLESIINQCLGQAQKISTSQLLLPAILIKSFSCFYEMAESSWDCFVLLINLPMLSLKVHVKELLLVTFIVTSTWVYM
ncbi:hypothetical protein OIU77_023493 [Salix suchowensis]|uniref:Uncharacterized protein n=1 Tax=Salix suchowensis TaxID=1278906 RepID=A0ABQ9C404_9ROSI|nr:hypothetical protein OIU77_023493 [Salix suchowensis]